VPSASIIVSPSFSSVQCLNLFPIDYVKKCQICCSFSFSFFRWPKRFLVCLSVEKKWHFSCRPFFDDFDLKSKNVFSHGLSVTLFAVCCFVCLSVCLSFYFLSFSLPISRVQVVWNEKQPIWFSSLETFLLLGKSLLPFVTIFYGWFFVCLHRNKFEFIKKFHSSSNKWYNFSAKLQTHKTHFQLIFQYFYFLDWKIFARNWIIVKPSTDIPQI